MYVPVACSARVLRIAIVVRHFDMFLESLFVQMVFTVDFISSKPWPTEAFRPIRYFQ